MNAMIIGVDKVNPVGVPAFILRLLVGSNFSQIYWKARGSDQLCGQLKLYPDETGMTLSKPEGIV